MSNIDKRALREAANAANAASWGGGNLTSHTKVRADMR